MRCEVGFHIFEIVGRRVEGVVGRPDRVRALGLAKPLREAAPTTRDTCHGLEALELPVGQFDPRRAERRRPRPAPGAARGFGGAGGGASRPIATCWWHEGVHPVDHRVMPTSPPTPWMPRRDFEAGRRRWISRGPRLQATGWARACWQSWRAGMSRRRSDADRACRNASLARVC